MIESDDGRISDTETEDSTQTAKSIIFEQKNIDAGTVTTEEKPLEEMQQQENGGDDDDDDDEFGDFEEAAAAVSATTSIQEPDDPFPETPTKNINFGFAKFEDSPKLTPQRSFESPVSNMPSLNDLITDQQFWDFEDSAASSMVEGSVNGIEYFDPFDDGKFSEDINLPQDYLNSLKLWSEICFVEDTAALKFQWNKSKLYEGMLAALNMNSAKAAPRETVALPILVPTSPSPLQLDLPETRFKPNDDISSRTQPQSEQHQQQQRRREEGSPAITAAAISTTNQTPSSSTSTAATTNNDQSLDSLYVPPVNFDWHSSGLSNPFTGASISDISNVLECNFETKNDKYDSLEDELERLGLGRTNTVSSTNTQELTFGNNAINLDEILRPQAGSNGNKVAELSVDAKALLNALPNYNFMLSKILMFPLNK